MPELATYCPNCFTPNGDDHRCPTHIVHPPVIRIRSNFGPGSVIQLWDPAEHVAMYNPELRTRAHTLLTLALQHGWPVARLESPHTHSDPTTPVLERFLEYICKTSKDTNVGNIVLYYREREGLAFCHKKDLPSTCTVISYEQGCQVLSIPPIQAQIDLTRIEDLDKLMCFFRPTPSEYQRGDLVYDLACSRVGVVGYVRRQNYGTIVQLRRGGQTYDRSLDGVIALQLSYYPNPPRSLLYQFTEGLPGQTLPNLIKAILTIKQQTTNNNNEVSRSTEGTRNGEGTAQAVYVPGCKNQIAVGVHNLGDSICYRGGQAGIGVDESYLSTQPTRIG